MKYFLSLENIFKRFSFTNLQGGRFYFSCQPMTFESII